MPSILQMVERVISALPSRAWHVNSVSNMRLGLKYADLDSFDFEKVSRSLDQLSVRGMRLKVYKDGTASAMLFGHDSWHPPVSEAPQPQ